MGSVPTCSAMRVQLDGRAAGFEPVGWEFESLYPRNLAVVKTEITRLCEGRAPGSTPGSEARADDARLVEHRHGKADRNGFDSRPRLLCLAARWTNGTFLKRWLHVRIVPGALSDASVGLGHMPGFHAGNCGFKSRMHRSRSCGAAGARLVLSQESGVQLPAGLPTGCSETGSLHVWDVAAEVRLLLSRPMPGSSAEAAVAR